MKVFFDTNIYVAEALLGRVAEQLLEATEGASWRIYASAYLLFAAPGADRRSG
jgi:hypothetical protein